MWTGVNPDITEYFEGLTIAYKIGIEGSVTTFLNINNLGNVSVVKNTNEGISVNYSVDSIILLNIAKEIIQFPLIPHLL